MIGERLQDAFNEQIKNEIYSGYLYLSMSAYAEAQSLPGFAHWFRKQAAEELEHAMKLFDHVADRGGRVVLQTIDAPPTEFESPRDLFVKAHEHEQLVTRLINELYAAALDEGDYAAQAELHWFITEQVEEEKNTGQIVEELEMAGDRGHVLLMLDRALGQRA